MIEDTDGPGAVSNAFEQSRAVPGLPAVAAQQEAVSIGTYDGEGSYSAAIQRHNGSLVFQESNGLSRRL